MKLRRSLMLPLGSSMFLLPLFTATAVLLLSRPTEAKQDLREGIINGNEPCFDFTPGESLFLMNCSVLHWQTEEYGPDTYISLGANETFDGRTVENRKSYVDLSGMIDFEGLFIIKKDEVKTFAEAPLIRNVHVRNGTTAEKGGFVVRQGQTYFMIDSCSSTGDIASWGGGICGQRCGQQNGEIKIMNSYSTGKIKGTGAGGITGSQVGYDDGIVNITNCYSTGNIEESKAGGICGEDAGFTDGKVYIKQCYSTGDIVSSADQSGGIVGQQTGVTEGYVHIQECFSTGQISGRASGGIIGSQSADDSGEVHILDCYTRGDIVGLHAGGITGLYAGGCCGEGPFYGNVYINNTYVGGIVRHTNAGGIIGGIHANFKGHTVHVQYSVYNDTDERKIIGLNNGDNLGDTGNSYDLTNIRGKMYHYDGIQRWDDDTWVINETDTLPILRFQLPTSRTSSLTAKRRILPVQRPPRSVKQHSSQGKRRRKSS